MTQTGIVYGQALYQLCQEESVTHRILPQLQALRSAFRGEPEYIRLLSSPALSKQERCHLLDQGFRGKIHPYLLNFLKILTEKGYIRHFSDCCEAFQAQYNQDNGILPVTAVTALELTQVQSQRLREKLAFVTGKSIELTNRVDPAVIGGMRLDYDGKRVDDTIAHRLDAVRSLLQETVL